MSDYFNRKGWPISKTEYFKLHADKDYVRVAETTLPDGKWVSTVWLGYNYNFGDEGPPLIFETMVFPSKKNLVEVDMRRYQTEEGATFGHEMMVLREKWQVLKIAYDVARKEA